MASTIFHTCKMYNLVIVCAYLQNDWLTLYSQKKPTNIILSVVKYALLM